MLDRISRHEKRGLMRATSDARGPGSRKLELISGNNYNYPVDIARILRENLSGNEAQTSSFQPFLPVTASMEQGGHGC
jgi:hypothetical protein